MLIIGEECLLRAQIESDYRLLFRYRRETHSIGQGLYVANYNYVTKWHYYPFNNNEKTTYRSFLG